MFLLYTIVFWAFLKIETFQIFQWENWSQISLLLGSQYKGVSSILPPFPDSFWSLIHVSYGLNCAPTQFIYWSPNSSQCGCLFGERVSTEVVRLKMKLLGWTLTQSYVALLRRGNWDRKETQWSWHTEAPCEDTEVSGHHQPKEGCSRRSQLCQHPDLGLPNSRTVRNLSLLFVPASL